MQILVQIGSSPDPKVYTMFKPAIQRCHNLFSKSLKLHADESFSSDVRGLFGADQSFSGHDAVLGVANWFAYVHPTIYSNE